MKEEDLSVIKRYPIVGYLERKGTKPVRLTPAYVLYRSPLRAETHPSFKVDTEKNLWIDYAEGRGGSIIDLCMRLESCTLSEAIHRLGQNAPDDIAYSSRKDFAPNNSQPAMAANGARRLISISDTCPISVLSLTMTMQEEKQLGNLSMQVLRLRICPYITRISKTSTSFMSAVCVSSSRKCRNGHGCRLWSKRKVRNQNKSNIK